MRRRAQAVLPRELSFRRFLDTIHIPTIYKINIYTVPPFDPLLQNVSYNYYFLLLHYSVHFFNPISLFKERFCIEKTLLRD